MGQSTRAYVDNIRMSVRTGKIYVTYDLVDKNADRLHEIDLIFKSETGELRQAISLSGDIGNSVTAGQDKTIVWDIHKDMRTLSGKMSPQIILDHSAFSSRYYGGPENAWYSLLMPGLGDTRVADPEGMIIKPWVRTVSSWGLISLGVAASINRSRNEGHIETYLPGYGWYDDDLTYDASLEKRYVEGSVQYWLFRRDAEIFFVGGLAIWAADIIWVYTRGKANQKLIRGFENQELSLVPLHQGFGFSYRVNF
jgi:hypothetical protein